MWITSPVSPAARATNSGSMFISLKPLSERTDDAQKVIARLRAKLAKEPGLACS
ncbi:Multidrug transporter MdtC [Serratia fonticola]|uniref:Multidrug transporter MdtC n=1 Tax=Serratia fonticola TaxID=47917 RepID=A0A4U9WIJ6_SERFO|nr:Multidrug transporter MdtC [Serratia fonticola]